MKKSQIYDMAFHAYELSKNKKYDSSMYIYDQTNEDLNELFKHYPIKDKDVLSVLASSDQYFSCQYLDAKSVDTFDKVYLSSFYFYLRKWIMEYQNKFYPHYSLFYNGNKDVFDLITSVEPHSIEEDNAKFFWELYLMMNNYKISKKICEVSTVSFDKPYTKDPYAMDKIKRKMPYTLPFKWMDLFHPILDNSKKYDVIVLSNMLEYAKNKKELIMARQNIENLLKDEGIAICSYKRPSHANGTQKHNFETKVLTQNSLVLGESFKYYEPLFGQDTDLSYSYHKVRK